MYSNGDGNVTVQLRETFAADVELHTGDGHISLDMPVSVEGRLGHNDIHGKLNGGGNLLTIHTGDGSISLGKSWGRRLKRVVGRSSLVVGQNQNFQH